MISSKLAASLRQNAMRVLPAAVLVAATVMPLAASAQTTFKVGAVDVRRLIEESPQAQEVGKKLETEFASRRATIVAAQQKLKTQQETRDRDGPVMGEAQRTELNRQIDEGLRATQRSEADFMEDLEFRRNEELGKLQRDILTRLQTYGREQKYDLIVADALFFSDAVDITDELLAVLKGGAGQ